jgi:hypothetical protein
MMQGQPIIKCRTGLVSENFTKIIPLVFQVREDTEKMSICCITNENKKRQGEGLESNEK